MRVNYNISSIIAKNALGNNDSKSVQVVIRLTAQRKTRRGLQLPAKCARRLTA